MSPPEPAGPGAWRDAPVPTTVVLGVGNLLYGDEGVGVCAARALERAFRFTPEVEVVDGATLGFTMVDVFLRARTLIVLDALAADAPPGTIFRLPAAELRTLGPEYQPTAHEVDPLHLLQLAPLFGEPPDTVLIGIVPACTEQVTVGLSPPLAAAFGDYVGAVLAELGAHGVRAEEVAPPSLDDALTSLVSSVR